MFQKPAFGANTSFGMSSTFGSPAASTSSPFGGFKPATSGTFGAPPAFGAATSAQPAPAGGLFGATNTSGGLFGATATPAAAPAFGTNNTGFGFGANASTGGLFNTSSGGGLFQPQQTAAGFGAKPAGFGFGATNAQTNTSGLFGTAQPANTGLFGQQNNTMGGGGLFANNPAGGFGQPAAGGTGHVKYSPLVGTDVVVKGGASQNINIKHHCITCMKEYEGKSLEELRLEDYAAGRKGAAQAPFGYAQPENKPLFGATNTFGAPATSSAGGVFGAGATAPQPGFGQPSTFSFGNATQTNTNTTSMFGAQRPAFGAANTTGAGLFGASASTQAPTFGTNTSTFGFGSNMQNQSTGGLFGAKPATTGFGAAPASTGFGSFGAGGLFGAKPTQTQAPTFGATQPGVGSMAGGFGTNTSTSGGLFGGASTFGKPAAAQPSFGFGAAQPTLGLGAGLGASAFGANKPAPGFGALGGGMFPQQTNNTFRTGLDSGLGGGMFGNTSSLGSSLGMGVSGNNTTMVNLSGSSGAGSVHQQILALAARPYGDQPLFKDLLPNSSTTAEDVLKPTNPQAQAAALARAGGSYRVTSPPALRLELRPRAHTHGKKSLFEGLEESDASLEDKLSLKPSRKRLVLRHNQRNDSQNDSQNDSVDASAGHTYRSQEENEKENEKDREVNRGVPDKENNGERHTEEAERVKRNIDFPNLDLSSERQASWLNSSKRSWSGKEPATDEPTPRIYPNLDNDIQSEVSERRSSWLTTKTLRKPLSGGVDSAENSVRELGVKPRDTTDTLSDSNLLSLSSLSWDFLASTRRKITRDISKISVSDEEPATPRELPPHPAGVRCTRFGYYTIPTLEEMTSYMRPDGTCKVPHLTIGRTNYGNVYYDTEVDVAGLNIDELVHFLNKEVIVYPEDLDKPPVGQGLNRRAVVTLDRVWPRDKTERRPIDDPDRLLKMEYEARLRRVCDKHDTSFIEYRPQTGSWVFRVEHFSKYGLTDSDEEEDAPDVLKRQLVTQTLQKNAATLTKPLVAPAGLGGLGLSGGGLISSEDSIYAMQQSSINLLSGASKAFEMDTTEENMESHSLYQDNRAFCVKSPTSELARLEHRQSARLQLMKASLYAEPDIEDDVSVSTGDQLVPMSAPNVPEPACSSTLVEQDSIEVATAQYTEEVQMKPLIVQPHSIVLRYHRKIPPFKHTIAGRLGAACIADLSVCRARHSRVGFGPSGTLVFASTHDTIADLPPNADLSDMNKYVSGRGEDDWSEPLVARLALGRSHSRYNVQEVLSRHLESLFSYSTFVDTTSCPRLQLLDSPRERYAALQQIIRDSEMYAEFTQPYGVSGAYCLEVWKLCDALWGADLQNNGVAGRDDLSLVVRHRGLLAWLAAAVAELTDAQLARPAPCDPLDESDGHSARVWTLVLGGRAREACRVARARGDHNMAALLAQAAGDPSFRSLVSRQLSLWRECGASALVSGARLATLQLISAEPPAELREADWKQALYATAKYLCPQVPSLEQVIRRYEAQFTDPEGADPEGDDPEVDLTRVCEREVGMRLPLPPYVKDYDVTATEAWCPASACARALDARYSLVRARALHTRPAVTPPQYTPDPLDYSLSFVLGVWFGQPSIESVVGAASQLEAAGAWHRAVHALCYLTHDSTRAHLIREVLSRHAPSSAEDEDSRSRLELMKKLRVPEEWLLLAQADRAKYEHRPQLAATHLAAAGRYNAAHELLVDQLLPEAVLSDSVSRLAPLLATLGAAAGRQEVAGWERGGAALQHYAHVCEQVRTLVSSAGSGGAALDALRPAVAAACRALEHLPPKNCAAAAARAEMGARLVQLAGAGAGARGGAARALPALLRALRLPPDTVAPAQLQITSELAEQAAELCIEPSSVPI